MRNDLEWPFSVVAVSPISPTAPQTVSVFVGCHSHFYANIYTSNRDWQFGKGKKGKKVGYLLWKSMEQNVEKPNATHWTGNDVWLFQIFRNGSMNFWYFCHCIATFSWLHYGERQAKIWKCRRRLRPDRLYMHKFQLYCTPPRTIWTPTVCIRQTVLHE